MNKNEECWLASARSQADHIIVSWLQIYTD